MKLTKRTVDAPQSEGDERRIWDTDIVVLASAATAPGNITFSSTVSQTGGSAGRLSADTARLGPLRPRAEARRLLGRIADGEDPVETKAIERADLTVSQLCDLYLAQPVITLIAGPRRRRPRSKSTGAT